MGPHTGESPEEIMKRIVDEDNIDTSYEKNRLFGLVSDFYVNNIRLKNVLFSLIRSDIPIKLLKLRNLDNNVISQKVHLLAAELSNNHAISIEAVYDAMNCFTYAFGYGTYVLPQFQTMSNSMSRPKWVPAAPQHSESPIFTQTDSSKILSREIANTFTGQNISISDDYSEIGKHAFYDREDIIHVNIPNGTTAIGNGAFERCSHLKSINIPNGVTAIGKYAFYGCSCLTSVSIPGSVTNIGDNAFGFCRSLKSISVNSQNTKYLDVDGALFDKNKTILIQYPAGSPLTNYEIPDRVAAIAVRAFEYCSYLTSVTIPDSVSCIESGTFWFCKNLASVTIPNSVTRIGPDAFWFCKALTITCSKDSFANEYCIKNYINYIINDAN